MYGEFTVNGTDYMTEGMTINGEYHGSHFWTMLNPANYETFLSMAHRG